MHDLAKRPTEGTNVEQLLLSIQILKAYPTHDQSSAALTPAPAHPPSTRLGSMLLPG